MDGQPDCIGVGADDSEFFVCLVLEPVGFMPEFETVGDTDAALAPEKNEAVALTAFTDISGPVVFSRHPVIPFTRIERLRGPVLVYIRIQMHLPVEIENVSQVQLISAAVRSD